MKLDVKDLQTLYLTLKEGRKVSKINFTQSDIYKIGHTINIINSLRYNKAMLGDEMLSDYEIPSAWAELIQPARIKFSSDELAKDYKDTKAYEGALVVDGAVYDEVLSAHEFKILWRAIVGSYKGKEDFKSVKEAREEKTLDEIGKHGILDTSSCCIDNGVYIPNVVTIQTYESIAYVIDNHRMFERWLSKIIFS